MTLASSPASTQGKADEVVYEKRNAAYDFDDPAMQVYASYAFRRDFVSGLNFSTSPRNDNGKTTVACKTRSLTPEEKLRVLSLGYDAVEESTVADVSPKEPVRFDLCDMKMSIAWHLALRNLKKDAVKKARLASSVAADADAEQNMKAHIALHRRESELVYFPCFVVDYCYGTTLNTSQERVEDKFQVPLSPKQLMVY